MNLLIYFLIPILILGNQIYNENLIKDALLIAQKTYCDNIKINNESIVEKVIEIRGDKAILGFNSKYNTIFIAFRGTSSTKDWINNFQVNQINPYQSFPNIGVAKGFYSIYTNLNNAIFSNIIDLSIKHNTNNLLLTGHSLGAALSSLLAFDIINDEVYKGYKIYCLITFGSPRVGNKEFADKINNINSFRVTHFYDIVPHLPQEFLKYNHIYQEVWYNEDNTEYKICNDLNNNEDNTCSNSCAPNKCTSTTDHLNYLNISMGTYGFC